MGVNAQERRPIDSKHPLWLVHVDVWNQADPQKIIDLIPADIKPYVCMNLSLSCSYDTELNIHMRPQNAIRTYKSWASICQKNGMWFTCQPASGGHTHILENDLETFEYFFKRYPNFLGWNYAEQFWGFGEAGDKYSSTDAARIALFAKLIPMHHKYGGFLTVSFCGNIWSHHLNPVGMMKRNADLMQACKDYPEAIVWLYKYTTSSCFYNNESVSFGPFVAGLTRNYGVRYDNCGYNGGLDGILGENHGKKYPVAAGIGTVMEQTCQNGGAIWDGPELIWTEDFQNKANSSSSISGYTQRNWGTFPGFRNAWMDMWRKILDGTMYIPTQQEVIDKTKIIIVNEVKSGDNEAMYAAWGDLYDGLYKQTDPFNKDNGQWMNNFWYLKSTGRYGTVPITPVMTELSKDIPTKVKKSTRTSTWSSVAAKTAAFNKAYPVVSTGDLFVSRYKNQLVTYTPYTYLNKKTTAKANIPLQYNTCKSLDLTWGKLSSALVKEYADSIKFYLNNFRSDTTTKQKDIIVVNGVTAQPSFKFTKREQALLTTPTAQWDAASGTYTVTVEHDGPVDLVVYCSGAETDRSTDMVADEKLELPKQPEPFYGTIIFEAEDMDFKNVKSVETTPYYSGYRWVRGHAGNGFVDMGTSTSSALVKKFNMKKAGDYKVAVRYMNTSAQNVLRVRVNTSAMDMKMRHTESNQWLKDTLTFKLVEGENVVYVFNTKGVNCMVDQVILTPAEEEMEAFAVTLRESEYGDAVADLPEAAEGEKVTISPNPLPGYALVGWDIIHGNIDMEENENGTYSFVMPDDNVTVQPLYVDTTVVYKMDLADVLSGTFPEGWRATFDGSVQEYNNKYSSGPRLFASFTGTYDKALYWRTGTASYGRQADYPLTLAPGKYRLTYTMAAWKGTPTYKAQILNSNETVLAQTNTLTATPNANGVSTSDISAATPNTLEFTVTKAGNYIINFESLSGGWSEYLLAECRVNKVPTPTAIDELFLPAGNINDFEIYNAEGVRLPSLQRGLNIIRRNGQDVKKVILRD